MRHSVLRLGALSLRYSVTVSEREHGVVAAPWFDEAAFDPDLSWARLLARCPRTLRGVAEQLPQQLGISRDDSSWREYVNQPLMLALPAALVDECARAPAALQRWVSVHHHAGFYGLTRDRLADRQAAPSLASCEVLAWLLDAWRDALVSADGRASHIDDAIARWERGAADSDRWPLDQRLSLDAYDRVTRDKCAYLWTASAAMLERAETAAARVLLIHECFERMMVAFQCFDDARDADEDRALFGASVGERLGLEGHALVAIGARILERLGPYGAPLSLARSLAAVSEAAIAAIANDVRPRALLAAALLAPSFERSL